MTQTKEKLLELRKKASKRRPHFIRQDYHHRMRVEDDYWRSPKGRHSKMRQKIHGHRKKIAVGYRGPVEVRGLHRTGANFVRIENLAQLMNIDPKNSVVIVSSTIGAKKRYEILKAVVDKKISFANINAPKFITDFEAKQKAKKEAKAKPSTKAAPKAEEKKIEKKVEAPHVVKTTPEVKPKLETNTKPQAGVKTK